MTSQRDAASMAALPKSNHGIGENDDDASAMTNLRKDLRRAKKVAKQLAKLGFDAKGEPLDNFSLLKYPVREWKFKVPGGTERDIVAVNPVVTFISVVTLWSLVLWNTVDPEGASKILVATRTHVSLKFTWFYQLVKMILLIFVVYIAIRYGHIHLGRKKDKPEFSSPAYFCMTFVAITGSGLLAYAVSDPLFHRESHFFAQAGYRSQDEIDMFAVNMPAATWGVGAFVGVALVAVCMSLAGYRFNLPMTFRSCFYPILGAYTWGWMGDCIDSLSIIVMVTAMCTMLATAAMQALAGLVHWGLIGSDLNKDEASTFQNVTIWVITIASTVSVITGLRAGIQYMSIVGAAIALLFTVVVLLLDDTKFLLNLTVQEIGYFVQHSMVQLNFWTDAFGQLREGSGRAVDGKAAESWWMDAWMIYYYAWAFSYSSVLGTFVAYISKGRTIREVVLCTLVGPIFFCIVSSSILGGIGLRQLRQAMEMMVLGEKHFNNSAHFLVDGSEICYNVPQEDIALGGETVFTNHLPGVSPVCRFDPANPSSAMYNVLDSFHASKSLSEDGLGTILSVLFVLGCTIFYTSHSDSATFIVDTIASNGRKNYHWTRRMFWSGTVAALATALLSTRDENALASIVAATIIGSLPMTILLCFLLQSVTLFCQAADKLKDTKDSTEYLFPDQPTFGMPVYGGVFNAVEYVVSLGRVNAARIELEMHQPTSAHFVEVVKGIFVPFASLHRVLRAAYPENAKSNAVVVACYALAYVGWISLVLASTAYPGLKGVAATAFLSAGAILGMVRLGFRTDYNIRSNCMADFLGSLFLWPQVLAQMRLYDEVAARKLDTASKRDKRNESVEEPEFDA